MTSFSKLFTRGSTKVTHPIMDESPENSGDFHFPFEEFFSDDSGKCDCETTFSCDYCTFTDTDDENYSNLDEEFQTKRNYFSMFKDYLIKTGVCTIETFNRFYERIKSLYYHVKNMIKKFRTNTHLNVKVSEMMLNIFGIVSDIIFTMILWRTSKDKQLVLFVAGHFLSREVMRALLKVVRLPQYPFKRTKYKVQSFIKESGTFEKINGYIESTLANLMHTVFRDAVSLNILPTKWSSKLRHIFSSDQDLYMKPVTILDFITNLFAFLDVFIDKAREVIKGEATLASMFQSGYSHYMREARILIKKQTFFKISNSDTDTEREHILNLRQSLKNHLLKGKDLIRTVKPKQRDSIRSICVELGQAKMAIDVRIRSMSRPAPIGIIVVGPPGVGKSTVLKAVHKIWAYSVNKTFEDNMVFTRNVDSKHWTNYDPLSNPIIHYSELSSQTPHITQNKGDPILSEILRVIDVAPMSAEMADIESKGKVQIIPELVTADTNTASLNAKYTNAAPSAVLRRFLFVKVEVKDQYRSTTDNSSLDPRKVHYAKDNLNLWNFEVYTQRPQTNHQSIKEILFTCDNMKEFRDQLVKVFTEREVFQRSHKSALERDPSDYTAQSWYGPSSFYMHLLMLRCLFVRDKHSTWFHYFFMWALFFRIAVMHSYSYLLNFFEYSVWGLLHTVKWISKKTGWNKGSFFSAEEETLKILGTVTIFLSFSLTIMKVTQIVYGFSPQADVSEVEETIGADFPLPRKKTNTDNTYDDVVEFEPRVRGNAKQHNQPSHVISAIERNKRYVCIETSDGKKIKTVFLGIIGNLAVLNTHSLMRGPIKRIVISVNRDFQQSVIRFTRGQFLVYTIDNDISFIILPSAKFKNITDYLMPTRQMLDFKKKNNNPGMVTCFGKQAVYSDIPLTINIDHTKTMRLVNYIKTTNHYQDGDCGSPYPVVVGNVTTLAAIHSAANGVNDKLGAIFSKEDVNDAIEHFKENGYSYISSSVIDTLDVSRKLHKKNPINYEQVTGITVFGEITSLPRTTHKSRLKNFPLTKDAIEALELSLVDEEGKPKFGPPKMRPFVDHKGTFISPFNNWLRKVKVDQENYINPQIMSAVADAYAKHIIENIDLTFTPLKMEVAINGFVEDFYTRPMNKSTSAGVLFPGKKTSYLIKNDDGTYSPSKKLIDSVSEIYNSLLDGQSPNAILGASLKDEVLPYEKVVNGKTRIFFSVPIDALIVQRMLLMPFYSAMNQYRDVFKCKIGINMDSPEADRLFKELSQYGDRIFEGDYSGYDTSMPFLISTYSYQVVMRVLAQKGYTAPALRLTKTLLDDSVNPIINFNGTLLQVPGLQPSGKYGTAEDNSLRGILLLGYFFAVMYTPLGVGHRYHVNDKHSLNDFFKLPVSSYGDDMVAGVPPEYEAFNALNYSKFCKSEYNMKFTSATKGDIDQKFVTVKDMTFLKRNFRYHPLLKRHVAALDKSSIAKSLMMFHPSVDKTERALAAETTNAALRSMFMWCDTKEEYNRYREKLKGLMIMYYGVEDETMENYYPVVDTFLEKEKTFNCQSKVEYPVQCTHCRKIMLVTIDNEVTAKFNNPDLFFAQSSIDQKVEHHDSSSKTGVATLQSVDSNASTEMQHGLETVNTYSNTIKKHVIPPPTDYSVKNLLSNYFYIGEFQGSTFSFWPYYELFLKPAVQERIIRHVSFSAGITIRFEWAAQIDEFGLGYACYYPNFSHNASLMYLLQNNQEQDSIKMRYLCNNPTKTRIWLENATSATLSIPFYSVNEYASFSGVPSTQWLEILKNLGLVYVNMLSSSSEMKFNVYIKFDDLKLGPQIPYYTQSKVEEHEPAFVNDGKKENKNMENAVNFSEIFKIPTYCTHLTLAENDNTAFLAVNPMSQSTFQLNSISENFNIPRPVIAATNMSYFSKAFAYWRGSITYDFSVIAHKLARGFIRLEYIPGIFFSDSALTRDVMGSVQSYTIDISTKRQLRVTIPMTHLVPHFSTNLSRNAAETTNGYWRIRFSGITNSTVSPQSTFLWIEYHSKDIHFMEPTNLDKVGILRFRPILSKDKFFTQALVTTAESAVSLIETGLEIATAVKGLSEVYKYFTGSDKQDIGESLMNQEGVCTMPLLKTATLFLPRYPLPSSSYKLYDRSYPIWVQGSNNSPLVSFETNKMFKSRYMFFEHCRNCFVFMGGSTRWSVTASDLSGHFDVSFVELDHEKMYYNEVGLNETNFRTHTGASSINCYDEKFTIEMKYTNNVVREYSMYDPFMKTEYRRLHHYAVASTESQQHVTNAMLSFSVGPDFRFECFVGAPFLMASYHEGDEPTQILPLEPLRISKLPTLTFNSDLRAELFNLKFSIHNNVNTNGLMADMQSRSDAIVPSVSTTNLPLVKNTTLDGDSVARGGHVAPKTLEKRFKTVGFRDIIPRRKKIKPESKAIIVEDIEEAIPLDNTDAQSVDIRDLRPLPYVITRTSEISKTATVRNRAILFFKVYPAEKARFVKALGSEPSAIQALVHIFQIHEIYDMSNETKLKYIEMVVKKLSSSRAISFITKSAFQKNMAKERRKFLNKYETSAYAMASWPFVRFPYYGENDNMSVWRSAGLDTSREYSNWHAKMTLNHSFFNGVDLYKPLTNMTIYAGQRMQEYSKRLYVHIFCMYFMIGNLPNDLVEEMFQLCVKSVSPKAIILYDDWYTAFRKWRIEWAISSRKEDSKFTRIEYIVLLPGETRDVLIEYCGHIYPLMIPKQAYGRIMGKPAEHTSSLYERSWPGESGNLRKLVRKAFEQKERCPLYDKLHIPLELKIPANIANYTEDEYPINDIH